MPEDHAPQAPRLLRIDPERAVMEPLDLDPAAFQSPLPAQSYHLIFEDATIGLAVGIWDTTTMQEAFGPYPGDEYITVLDGGFAMVDAAGVPVVTARAGDGVTFRNGVPTSWKQEGYLRKIYLTLQPPGAAAPAIAAAAGGFQVVAPDRLPQGVPDADGTTREVIFRNDAGTMTVTLCAFAALDLPAAPAAGHRLVRVMAGEVSLTEPGQPPATLGRSAHVFLPAGTVAGWRVADGALAIIVDVAAT